MIPILWSSNLTFNAFRPSLQSTCRSFLFIFILILSLFSYAGAPVFAEDWPAWRKDGSGVSKETDLPYSWSDYDSLVWKTPLAGEGFSSPIIWGDKVFITNAIRKDLLEIKPASRSIADYAFQGALLVVIGLAGWWYLGSSRVQHMKGRPPRLLVRFCLLVTFITVTCLVKNFGQGILVGRPSVSALFPDGPVPTVTFFGGYLGALSVLLLGHLLKYPFVPSQEETPAEESSGSASFLSWLQLLCALLLAVSFLTHRNTLLAAFAVLFLFLGACRFFGVSERGFAAAFIPLFVLGMAATFFASAYSFIAPPSAISQTVLWGDPPTPHVAVDEAAPLPGPGPSIAFHRVAILVLGLIAAVGSLPRASVWRLLGSALALLMLGGILLRSLLSKSFEEWVGDIRAAHLMPFITIAVVSLISYPLVYLSSRRDGKAAPSSSLWDYGGPLFFFLTAIVLFMSTRHSTSARVPTSPKPAIVQQVVCIDLNSGAILWERNCCACDINTKSQFIVQFNSLATPTPATDGQYIYAHFGGAGIYCLDMQGQFIWSYPDPVPMSSDSGAASSLVLWRDLIIGTYDVNRSSLTVALNKHEGNVCWKSDRTHLIEPLIHLDKGENLCAYDTPIVMKRNGACQLISHSNTYLCGYDIASGVELWKFRTPSTEIVPSPVLWHELVIVAGGPFGARNKCFLAVGLRGTGEETQAQESWNVKRNQPEQASPVVYGDRVYAVGKGGIATCLDAETAQVLWKERLPGDYSASVVAGDGRVYFCNTEGLTTVVRAGAHFKVVSRNQLNETVMASFAVSRGRLLIRGDKHLFCIGNER
jgi:outer membrane protein assembly factor BamB